MIGLEQTELMAQKWKTVKRISIVSCRSEQMWAVVSKNLNHLDPHMQAGALMAVDKEVDNVEDIQGRPGEEEDHADTHQNPKGSSKVRICILGQQLWVLLCNGHAASIVQKIWWGLLSSSHRDLTPSNWIYADEGWRRIVFFSHIFFFSIIGFIRLIWSCWHLTCLFFSSSHVFWPHEHWRVLLGLSAICIPWDCHYHGFGDYDDYGGYDDDILTFHISNVSWGNYGCRSDIKTCVTNIILRTAINPKQGYIIVDGSCKLDFAQNKQLLRCLIRNARNLTRNTRVWKENLA